MEEVLDIAADGVGKVRRDSKREAAGIFHGGASNAQNLIISTEEEAVDIESLGYDFVVCPPSLPGS